MPDAAKLPPPPSAFTRGTQRLLTALRVTAYSMAVCFMIVMVLRGVWVTRDQMEAEAERSIRSARAAMVGMPATGSAAGAQHRALLRALASQHVELRTEPLNTPSAAHNSQAGGEQMNQSWRLVALVDHESIWIEAVRVNVPYILFVLALGLPTVAIFLYMGWLVNRPALQLLAFAQASGDAVSLPPDLPKIWHSVLARLQQLREQQRQMEAFLANAPFGMIFFNANGRVAMMNRSAAASFGQTPETMLGKGLGFFAPYLPDAGDHDSQLFARTLAQGEPETLETTFTGHDAETRHVQITSFPVHDPDGTMEMVGIFVVDVTEEKRTKSKLEESRSQLIAFFDNLPTSIYLKRVDHEVVFVSRHLAEQYGKRPEDMIGQQEYDLHIAAMKPYLEMMDRHILSTGEAILLEGDHLQFNRRELVSRFPVFNEQGQITHIGGMNFDIDERFKAQAALQESKALFEAFIQHAPNPMALMDPKGQYVMVNDTAASFYGQTPEALIASGAAAINHRFPQAETVIKPMFARVCKNREFEAVSTFFRTMEGELREFSFALFPILDADGNLAYIGNISHDITEERQARAALMASRDALHQSEKLAALGSLLAGVSHELNNPLAAVIGQAALLSEDLENTGHADRIAKIKRAADRCARIVQSFLAMARQKAPEYRSVDISEQVRAAVELTEYQMRAANVALQVHTARDLPLIKADPDQLHQVIVNLLTNARQALEDIDGERRISITSSVREDRIRLAIADNGNGIDPATRDRLFDPFFSTKAAGKGTGIGLSFSLGIVQAHGGTISIEDAEVGTVFVITLPIESGAEQVVTPTTAQSAKAKGRALIIDDEEDVAETLADMLARMGMSITVAVGGMAGQNAMAGGAEFDLVLSDIRMPDCDGPTLYAWITANRPDLAGRVAFVTGDTLSGIAADFLEETRCPVLEKPFTPAGLRDLVAAMLPA
ncbi:PAS domain S-box protein [Novosphingobium sp.]|uniref:hybrid sensor histidine kinase/response regulator n=1 Tax=Novosphingobium sp. TaxID=1874826 RepID=UPI0026350203|nr:PAS domain S-box protein [Novosphingobium sp.]